LRPELLDSPLGLLPIKLDLVIKEILRLKLEDPNEIDEDLVFKRSLGIGRRLSIDTLIHGAVIHQAAGRAASNASVDGVVERR
jgi:hypothetical protein